MGSLGVAGDVSYTCETAGHFYLYQVLSRWEKFEEDIALYKKEQDAANEKYDAKAVMEKFPFHLYFSNAPQPVFGGVDFDDEVELGFKFDNILMEESAQILEIETFIPLLLQNPQDGFNRLKRWIMIGDHHQLPPVIKNQAFQKYSNMEQSLFTRFVRLGVPIIQLDMQGRARPTICELYNWRYEKLGNLPHTSTWP